MAPRLMIRSPEHDDCRSIERLQVLDDAQLPDGELLVAEVDGELWAAVSLDTGDGVADPFRPSGRVLETLQATAQSLRRGSVEGHRAPGRRARVGGPGWRYLRRGGAAAFQQVHRARA